MTFVVDWSTEPEFKFRNTKPEQRGADERQLLYACFNIVHEFIQSIGGSSVLSTRDENQIPKCQGITEWSEKKYGIRVVDRYVARIQNHAHLRPNPMDGVDPNVEEWPTPYIPYYWSDPPWGDRFRDPTKDELRLFMDPVFVGPRSKEERKFFQSQAIKLGLRKKHFRSGDAYERCQTPELRRWQEDVSTSRFMFGNSGLESATEWATERGWKEAHFWSTTHLDVDSFEITLPGCEGKPDTYEKLLFVMRFAGKS